MGTYFDTDALQLRRIERRDALWRKAPVPEVLLQSISNGGDIIGRDAKGCGRQSNVHDEVAHFSFIKSPKTN